MRDPAVRRRVVMMSWLGKRRSALIDEFTESYVRWREASDYVRTAYRRWSESPSQRSGLEFATYRVALDQEERAATIYSERAARLGAAPR
jgi:hypothetical protein